MRHALALLAAAWFVMGCDADQPEAQALALAPTDLLGEADGANADFARALPGGTLSFPTDHGPHPDYRAEWWYFTGHLQDANQHRYGFQLTFFRYALRPHETEGSSPWRTRQVSMAHFALTDEHGERYAFDERIGRSAVGLAGAEAMPFRVWHDDWSAQSNGQAFLPMTLRAGSTDASLSLTLNPGKPRVLQGDKGLSQKGRAPGNASWYYSHTRMPASGVVGLDGREIPVTGAAWLDREWSTSSLDPDIDGWDWFALQLGDGRDIMFYRLRNSQGNASPFSSGVIVGGDGETTPLTASDVMLEPLRRWRSERSGATYPVAWRLRLPAQNLDLEFRPLLDNQEQGLSVFYWEGAGRVQGTDNGSPVSGRGYAELTGYTPR